MPISELALMVGGAALGAPFSEMLTRMIRGVNKVKDFKPLFEDLASTMKRLVPLLQEIDMLQERLDPGNGELNFLVQTMLKANKMVGKCSLVREYSLAKKTSYTTKIQGIKKDFVDFCQVDLPLIQHKNYLLFRSLNMQEFPRVSLREAEALDDEQLAWAFQESFLLHRSREDEEERKRAARALKAKNTWRETLDLLGVIQESSRSQREEEVTIIHARELREDEELASAVQEINFQDEEEMRARELENDEQIARALQYDD